MRLVTAYILQLCSVKCCNKIILCHHSGSARTQAYKTMTSNSMRDLVTEIQPLTNKAVHMKNRDRVNCILNKLVQGGANKLQVLYDFDRTITKQHMNGNQQMSSFGIFTKCRSLPSDYKTQEKALMDKYHPIEIDPTIPVPEKKTLMEEWWKKSHDLLIGLNVTIEEIDEVVSNQGPDLRDGCVDSFQYLDKRNIPILVFSAGLGNCVESVLRRHNIVLPNVKIVSNFLKYDNSGTIQGFIGRTIHVYNKNETALEGTDYYDHMEDRDNVILLGDSIGDATMANGVPHPNAVLKIGFLYDRIEESLPNYLETFDIVLVDDQTMNILNAILEYIQ